MLYAPAGEIVLDDASKADETARDRNASLLGQIAVLLGVPESVFSDPLEPFPDADGACELLRIWHSLKHMTDRRKLLAFARALSAAQR